MFSMNDLVHSFILILLPVSLPANYILSTCNFGLGTQNRRTLNIFSFHLEVIKSKVKVSIPLSPEFRKCLQCTLR